MRKRHELNKQDTAGIGKVVTGIVLGSIVGAAVSLLMAPATGEETRRRIREEVKGIQNRAKQFAGEVEDRGREISGEARGSIESVRENIAERVTQHNKTVSN